MYKTLFLIISQKISKNNLNLLFKNISFYIFKNKNKNNFLVCQNRFLIFKKKKKKQTNMYDN